MVNVGANVGANAGADAGIEQDGRAAPVLQLLLFELDRPAGKGPDGLSSRSRTNTVGLYDIAPRFVFFPGRLGGDDLTERGEARTDKPIDREFQFRGQTFNLTLKPAFIRRKVRTDEDGQGGPQTVDEWAIVFPGEREQIVEHVIRRLATERARLWLDKKERVNLRFTLYEVQRELERVKRTLSSTEIKEALTILHQSFVEIRAKGKGGMLELSSTVFPELAFRSENPEIAESYLQFNSLVANSIRSMSFRMMSYGWLMRFKSPVSRWLYNILTLEYETKPWDEPTLMHARAIIRDSGMNALSRPRDTFRAVRDAVVALQDEGILQSVEIEKVMEGRRLADEIYTMVPSEAFLKEIEAAMRMAESNANEFEQIASDMIDTSGFVRVEPPAAAALRRRRPAAIGGGKAAW